MCVYIPRVSAETLGKWAAGLLSHVACIVTNGQEGFMDGSYCFKSNYEWPNQNDRIITSFSFNDDKGKKWPIDSVRQNQ